MKITSEHYILTFMIVLIIVRSLTYMINFWPGFGSFVWNKKTQKQSMIRSIQTEINKSESKPKLYQSLKFMDTAFLLVYAGVLLLSNKKYVKFSIIPVKTGVFNLLMASAFLNYA